MVHCHSGVWSNSYSFELSSLGDKSDQSNCWCIQNLIWVYVPTALTCQSMISFTSNSEHSHICVKFMLCVHLCYACQIPQFCSLDIYFFFQGLLVFVCVGSILPLWNAKHIAQITCDLVFDFTITVFNFNSIPSSVLWFCDTPNFHLKL